MGDHRDTIDTIRAALAPHGIFLRGLVHFDGDGPEMGGGVRAQTIILLGNTGGSLWPAFSAWRARNPHVEQPLDRWSSDLIRPLAKSLGGWAYLPSDKPWQPFQQWAMRAEGLKASPLGMLIHPEFGLWHGYRGAIGFAEKIGAKSIPFDTHPCDHCSDTPCLTVCPVDAVSLAAFDVSVCRSHIHAPTGQADCMIFGCLARNACPIGVDYRYPPDQLRFHMAALGRI